MAGSDKINFNTTKVLLDLPVASPRWAWLVAAGVSTFCLILLLIGLHADTRWFIGIAFFTAAALFFIPLQKKEAICGVLFFILLPISINFYPLLLPLEHVSPVRGIAINGYDVPLLILTMFWLSRIARGIEKFTLPFGYVLAFAFLFLSTGAGLYRSHLPSLMVISILWAEIKCFAVFTILYHWFSKPKNRILAVCAILFALFPQAFVGFLQKVTNSGLGLTIFGEMEKTSTIALGSSSTARIGGLIGSQNQFAIYLGMTLPLGIALLFAPKPPLSKLFIILPLTVAGILLELFTYSRGGWISLALGIAVVMVASLYKKTGRFWFSFLKVFVGIVIAISLLIAISEPVRLRVSGNDGGAVKSRTYLMELASTIIRKHPAVGIGYGNFTALSPRYDATRNAISYAFPFPVHNEYMLLAAELGIGALLVFVFLIIKTFLLLFHRIKKEEDPLAAFICCGLAGCLFSWTIHHLFEYSYVLTNVHFWVLLALCTGSALPQKKETIAL